MGWQGATGDVQQGVDAVPHTIATTHGYSEGQPQAMMYVKGASRTQQFHRVSGNKEGLPVHLSVGGSAFLPLPLPAPRATAPARGRAPSEGPSRRRRLSWAKWCKEGAGGCDGWVGGGGGVAEQQPDSISIIKCWLASLRNFWKPRKRGSVWRGGGGGLPSLHNPSQNKPFGGAWGYQKKTDMGHRPTGVG